MGQFKSLEDLKSAVEAQGGVLTVPALDVRDAHGADRLGKIVRENIARALEGHGLNFFPRPLPGYQEQSVRLWKRGTPVAEVIEAALNPSANGDEILRTRTAGQEEEILRRIRELVCE
ncbi:MAG: hypothetical protein ACT4PO_16120 [Actinomycetota bacterium]